MKQIIVSIGMIIAMVGLMSACSKEAQVDVTKTTVVEEEVVTSNLTKSLEVDLSHLVLGDGQPLIQEAMIKLAPPRPADPLSLPQLDKEHWYDMEYAGFHVEKVNLPESPGDGAIGKTVINIVNGDHPYMTAYGIGAKKVADAYDIEFIQYSSDWNLELQNVQVDKAIAYKPDMIIINPLDVKESTKQLRKINEAGIPCVVSNMAPSDEGMQYAIAWTGPDDWGQFRMLAQVLADELDHKGGVAYLTHSVGGSVYYSRMMGVVTELNSYAPQMTTLDYQSPGFDLEPSKEVVAKWIEDFGLELSAIVCADDSGQILGALEALEEAGREDVVIVAAGNSKDGMDAVKNGQVLAITHQSAQADGAIAMKVAADWFNGQEVEAMSYLQTHVITKSDVDSYMPAEWRYED